MVEKEMFNITDPLKTPLGDSYEEGDSDREVDYSTIKMSLIQMGYKAEMIEHTILFFSPQSLEAAIALMSREKGVWQHNFVEDEGNKCLICQEESDHIDKKRKSNDDDSFNLLVDNDAGKRTSMVMTYDLIFQKINNRKSDIFLDEPNRISIGAHTCGVCMEDIPQDAKKKLHLECQHYFCKDCWVEHLSEKIINGEVEISCMEFTCGLVLPKKFVLAQIRERDDLVVKYDKFSRKRIVATNENMKFCPTPNCEGYAEKKNNEKYVTCSEGHNFCFNCMKAWHGKKNCADIIDEDFQKWKKSKIIKQCPKCKFFTEKNEGCNHMTCRSCRADWCWICQKLCNPSTHYQDGSCAGLQFSEMRCLQHWNCFFLFKMGRFLILWLFYYILFIPVYGICYCCRALDNLYLSGCCDDFIVMWVGIANFIALFIFFGIPGTILLSVFAIPALFYWPLLDIYLSCIADCCDIERLF